MTDQTIPADKIREIIASYRGRRVRGGMILDALKDLLPAYDILGHDWHFCTPGELTYIDQEADQ